MNGKTYTGFLLCHRGGDTGHHQEPTLSVAQDQPEAERSWHVSLNETKNILQDTKLGECCLHY